jgi:hypothetical protein
MLFYIFVRESDLNWVPPFDLDSGITILPKASISWKFSTAYYYGTLLLVGDDIAPKSIPETIFCSLIIIIGAIVSAFIFGNMAAIMLEMGREDEDFQESFESYLGLIRQLKMD